VALVLTTASLALLFGGHFVAYRDFSGFQSAHWNYDWGTLSGFAAVLAVLVSLCDRTARHLVGAVVAGFVAFLVVAGLVAPAFSFVGSTDGASQGAWEIVLGIVAFVLLTPRWTRVAEPWEAGRRRWRLTAWTRWAAYLVLLVPAAPTIFLTSVLVAQSGHAECQGDMGDACAEAYAGAFVGLVAVAALVVGLVLFEIGYAVLRSRRRSHAGS
jgi:hypothetical protein